VRAHCASSETRVGSRKNRPSTKASLWLACVNIQPWKRHQSLKRWQRVEGGGREHAHAPSQPRATLGNPSTPPFAYSATTATEKYASVGGVGEKDQRLCTCGVARPRPPTPHAAETVNSIPTKLTGGLATSAGVLAATSIAGGFKEKAAFPGRSHRRRRRPPPRLQTVGGVSSLTPGGLATSAGVSAASSSAGGGENNAAFPGRLMCTSSARPQTPPPPATSRADVGRHGLVDARRAGEERGRVGGEQQRGRRREQGGVSRAVDVHLLGEATDAPAARRHGHRRWAAWPR
jgi:hypothetical protein